MDEEATWEDLFGVEDEPARVSECLTYSPPCQDMFERPKTKQAKQDKKGRKDKKRKRKDSSDIKRDGSKDISLKVISEIREQLEKCTESLASMQDSVDFAIKSEVETLRAQVEDVLRETRDCADDSKDVLRKLEGVLLGVAGFATRKGVEKQQQPLRIVVASARKLLARIDDSVQKKRKRCESEKAPLIKERQSRQENGHKSKADLDRRHYAALFAVVEKHSKEIAELKQKHAVEVAQLAASQDKSDKAFKVANDAAFARIEAKHSATIRAIEAKRHAVAKTLNVQVCAFCSEEFYADECPRWNKKWSDVHCGNCPMGSCHHCGEDKQEPEGVCTVCSNSLVYTCGDCGEYGSKIVCEDCENDSSLHFCGHCDEFYHSDGEACCKYQRYGNPKFGMLKENYARAMGTWPF
mmetsp:Transcript_4466/g.12260  ORF Transcript_4466/g.12260 Transcript_4466/m.12260 type:complete len:410 (-) Transcript_4466:282-1511(-)